MLKGAQLFRIWGAEEHRPTRDLDLLGYGEPTEEAIHTIFTGLIQMDIDPDDGLEWGKVAVAPIRDELEYGGIRAKVDVRLAGARLGIQIDVGFGDAITPKEKWKRNGTSFSISPVPACSCILRKRWSRRSRKRPCPSGSATAG